MSFQLFTDSSSELSKALREKYNIDYFRMGIRVNDVDYHADISWEEYSPRQLYDWIKDPNVTIKTSLVPVPEFQEKAEQYLSKGIDILYIACACALSGSRNVFEMVKQELQEKYPDRKIISIDSCRAEMALGMLCIEAAKLRDQGKTIDEVAQWVEDNKQYYHEVGSVGTLKYLKAMGRVSDAAAFLADSFNIKPIIMFDIHGNNYSFKKVNGPKRALNESIEYIKTHMVEGVTDIVYLGHADCPETVEYLKKRIHEELHLKTEEFWIGPIVGISCGPGMYGCWFRGDLVTADSKKK